jgi:large subunit ribosomal protein L23
MATVDIHNVILGPVQSEKSYAGLENNQYVFRVHSDATKLQVRRAVEQLHGVSVISVNTAHVKAKPKRRGLFKGTKPGYKRATVQLKAGDTIKIFEGVH